MDKPGRFKCRGIEGSIQYGEAGEGGTPQIALSLDIKEVGVRTAFLFFSTAAAPYSIERLRALGWEGNDLADIKGIGKNEVDVDIKVEEFDGKTRNKYDIVVGAFIMSKPLDPKTFAAKVALAMGSTAGGPVSKEKPPF